MNCNTRLRVEGTLLTLLFLFFAGVAWCAETCPEPPLRPGLPGDATDDAAGRGQMFENIVVPGFTDQYVETSGTALVDVDRDGRLDIVVVHSGYFTDGHTLHLLLNRGCFRFQEHPIAISGSQISAADLGPGVQIPNLVDFNDDGFLDILLSRSGLRSAGNILLLSDGSFDRFVDRSADLDVRNLTSYSRQSSIADVDGDGWLDLLWVDRHEIPFFWGTQRNALFMNNGDGSYRPVNADVSGLDGSCASAEAADLDNDGLLDVIYVETPGNTAPGLKVPEDRYGDKVYWNTGAHGGAENHWLRVRFSGISDHRLIGAHVLAYEAGTLEGAAPKLVGMRAIHSNQSYRTGVALEAHFGLGQRERVDLEVRLLDGGVTRFTGLPADRYLTMDLQSGSATAVVAPDAR
jgi:hypothetical protein